MSRQRAGNGCASRSKFRDKNVLPGKKDVICLFRSSSRDGTDMTRYEENTERKRERDDRGEKLISLSRFHLIGKLVSVQ